MKKLTLNASKLQFKKQTIANLSATEMSNVNGGTILINLPVIGIILQPVKPRISGNTEEMVFPPPRS